MTSRAKMALSIVAAGIVAAGGCSEPDNTAMEAAETFDFVNGESRGILQPVPKMSPGDRDMVMLGKLLFHDTRLSGDDTVSCASCHDVSAGGDDGRVVAVGISGRVGEVNSPTVLNASLNFAQFWDGRAESLAEQVSGPIHNPIEMNSSWAEVVQKLNGDAELTEGFNDLFDDGITAANITTAIVAYESALLTPDSPFDRYLLGDTSAISEVAVRGYERFINLGCASCHQGRNIGGNMYQKLGAVVDIRSSKEDFSTADFGRFNVTGNEEDRFFFKVPSLRNIAETAPYFHDGSASTLEEAVRTMAYHQLGFPIADEDVSVIVEFLRSLSAPVDSELL